MGVFVSVVFPGSLALVPFRCVGLASGGLDSVLGNSCQVAMWLGYIISPKFRSPPNWMRLAVSGSPRSPPGATLGVEWCDGLVWVLQMLGAICKNSNWVLDVLWRVSFVKIMFWKRHLALREWAQHGNSEIWLLRALTGLVLMYMQCHLRCPLPGVFRENSGCTTCWHQVLGCK